MWRSGIFIWLVASGSVLAEVPESTLVEQMAAEKLARGLEMQRLEMRLTNIEQMLEQIIQAKNCCLCGSRTNCRTTCIFANITSN